MAIKGEWAMQNETVHLTSQNRPLAIVTGASSGIGRAFVELLAADGHDIALTARDEVRLRETADKLQRIHETNSIVIPQDLSEPEAATRIFEVLEREGRVASILINNAGFNVYGRFEDTDLKRELEMIRLHLIATTQLTKLFLRRRDRSRENMILNVSSVAALVPGPYVSIHFATRAHALSFSLALSEEFNGTDVCVTCLCPGPTRSAFFARAAMDDVRLARGWPMQLMDARDVARCGYEALKAGRRMVVPGVRNKIFALAADIAPRRLATTFTRWIMSRK
jgi:short-subunit dehydrogenase